MEMLATNIIPRHDGFRMCVLRVTRMSQMHRRNPQSAFASFHLIQLIYEMFYIHAKSSSKLRHFIAENAVQRFSCVKSADYWKACSFHLVTSSTGHPSQHGSKISTRFQDASSPFSFFVFDASSPFSSLSCSAGNCVHSDNSFWRFGLLRCEESGR